MENTQTLPKLLSGTHRVRFQDCDPFNHLNNSKYIDYMINVREDEIEAVYGFNLYERAYKQGIGWVVATNQISYLKPAFIMETVRCESQLIKAGKRSIVVEHRMYDETKTHLKSIMWSTLVHVNIKEQASTEHSEEFMQMFEDILNPVEAQSYEQRLANLRK